MIRTRNAIRAGTLGAESVCGIHLLAACQDDGTGLVAGPSSWTFMPADRCESLTPPLETRYLPMHMASRFTLLERIWAARVQYHPYYLECLDLGPWQVSDRAGGAPTITFGLHGATGLVRPIAELPTTWSDRPISAHRRIAARQHF